MELTLFGRLFLTYCLGAAFLVAGAAGFYWAATGRVDQLNYGGLDAAATVFDVDDDDRVLRLLWLLVGPTAVVLGGVSLGATTLGLLGYL